MRPQARTLAVAGEQQIDQAILNKVLSIQQLPDEDKEHIMYSIDGLIQHDNTRMAYKQ